MNRAKRVLNNERGGVEILVASLLLFVCCLAFMIVSIDYVLFYTKQNSIKNDLNAAVHAASLSIDERRLAKGFFELDSTSLGTSAQDMFYKYLQMNMRLNSSNRAIGGSALPPNSQVNIEELVYVDFENTSIRNLITELSACTLNPTPMQVTCSVILNEGTEKEIKREITQTVVGPSVLAIISSKYEGIGLMDNEPLLIPAVQEVYFRK